MAINKTVLRIDNIKTPVIESNNATLGSIITNDISSDLVNATIVNSLDVKLGKISVKDSIDKIEKKANIIDGDIDIFGNLVSDITLENGDINSWLKSQKNTLKSGDGFSINNLTTDKVILPFLKDFNISFNNIASENFVFDTTNTLGTFTTTEPLFKGCVQLTESFYFEAPKSTLNDFELFETTSDSYIEGNLFINISEDSDLSTIYINGSSLNELLENNDKTFIEGEVILI